jgi:hypothetical protein
MSTLRTALPRMIARSAFAIVSAITVALSTATIVSAKVPGQTYCYYKTCHRVKTLPEMRSLVGQEHTLPASFYDSCTKDAYNPCGLTSSGEVFRPDDADNAASPIYPNGTILLVWSPTSKRAAVLRINNSGPYWGNRKLDVSRAAAEKLGFKGRGVADLKARVLHVPSRAEITYRLQRRYQPVAGYIGQYASLDAAALATRAPGSNGQMLAANDEARLIAVLRPSLKTWPVVGQTMKQVAMSRSKAMPWPVIANYQQKLAPPVGIAKTVAIAWPVVGVTKAVAATAQKLAIEKRAFQKLAIQKQKAVRVAKLQARLARLAAMRAEERVFDESYATRITPSRGLAAAMKAEDILARTKAAKLRGGKPLAPFAKNPALKNLGDKPWEAAKRALKAS